jgi:hypothetical protein
MHCKDGRRLEISVCISIGQGRLSNYTKIVRICPRYVLVNQLTKSIRLWQDNSLLHPNHAIEHTSFNVSAKWSISNLNTEVGDSKRDEYRALFGEKVVVDSGSNLPTETAAHPEACFIATIRPSELITFHLPDTRIDRLLRIEYGSLWNLSSSVPADVTGEYFLTVTRSVDLRFLPHVSTRATPIYTVTLPSPDKAWDGELGAWFETDWGREKTLIVKGVKKGSFASYYTDITVGDELVCIDDTPVEQLTFEEAVKLLKSRLSPGEPGNQVTLTFLTLEEKMRNLRRKAVMGRAAKQNRRALGQNDDSEEEMKQTKDLLIDMKFLFQSIFIFVREPVLANPPHRITNRSLQWAVSAIMSLNHSSMGTLVSLTYYHLCTILDLLQATVSMVISSTAYSEVTLVNSPMDV